MNEEILIAAERGDISIVNHCLQTGCDADFRGIDQETPLHLASREGHTDIVETLIQAGADVNIKDVFQRTPVHYAVKGGHIHVVDILIKAEAAVNEEDWFKITPLHYAARGGDIKIVEILIQAGAVVNVEDKDKKSPLYEAARKGNICVVQALIHAGADVNVKDKDGKSPLHEASRKGYTGVVKLLVEAGVNSNSKDETQETPLHQAARRGHLEIVDALIQAGADVNLKEEVSPNDFIQLTEELIPMLSILSAYVCYHPRSPTDIQRELMVGALSYLKRFGQSPTWDPVVTRQLTVLDYAITGGQMEVVDALIKAGAVIVINDKHQNILLDYAVKNGYKKVVDTLIKSDADVNSKDERHETPLHHAVMGGFTDIVEVLLEAGADIYAKDKAGYDPIALSNGDVKKILTEFEDAMRRVPKEVQILGKQAMLKFVSALMKDSMVSNVIRVMLVGHFGVGKTTIAMHLLGQTVENIKSTDGIEVFINRCLYDTKKCTWHQNEGAGQTLLGVKDFIRLDLTDFAGQLIYYTTHQTYLTSRGLYLLVFNLALGLDGVVEDEDLYPGKNQHRNMIDFLEYWIAMIVTYARGEHSNFPKIILIGTHRDKIWNENEIRKIKDGIQERFNDLITSSQLVLRDDLFIDAKNMSDETRTTIRRVILEEGMKYKEFGERVPSSWIALQEKLIELKEKKQIIVRLDVIRKLNSELKIPLENEELEVFLKFLHNMGYVLYFDSPNLRDKIILDPKVVIDAMRSFITCERFVLQFWKKRSFNQMRRSGRVQVSHILEVLEEKRLATLSDNTYSAHMLGIMIKLDLICVPVIYNKGQRVSPDFCLVPCMMNVIVPQVPFELFNREKALTITFSSDEILPPAIFNRLVCSCLSCWEIFEGHFYNGLVVLRSGRFHLIEMKRDIKRIVVTFGHIKSAKRPDAQWCLAMKMFLKATIHKILAIYSVALRSTITCDSSDIDDLKDDAKADENHGLNDQVSKNCACKVYENCALEDVNLMRIAQQLRGIDLSILCAVLLNDTTFSSQIEIDFGGFRGDIKAFYVLQKWKRTTQVFTLAELKCLLKKHVENFNEHIVCQAMQNERIDDKTFVSTNSMLNVYEEFLSIVADRVTYEYMQLGLELGLKLTDIERLRIEKDNNVLQITRSMLQKWYNRNKEEATYLRLSMALQRCGMENLEWMDIEFDVEKARERDKKPCAIS